MYSARDDARLRAPGCPIRKSPDQSLFGGSPKLFAAYHVLHRWLAPRHSPCALISLTIQRFSHTQGCTLDRRYLLFSCQRPNQAPHFLLAVKCGPKLFFCPPIASAYDFRQGVGWWSGPGLNRQPPACKADALPIELPPRRASSQDDDGGPR